MAKNFLKYIGKNTSDSHQTSPHWLVTFTRFKNRDTKNYKGKEGSDSPPETRGPLIVENDCISVSVSTSKTNNTPNATIVLAAGDLNYMTAVVPGDFVIINMVNSSQKARELRVRAGNPSPINRAGDGFKGVFKINSVNEIISVDPGSGVKTLRYQVTAYGFSEFNQSIYYNPTIGKNVEKVLTYLLSEELLNVLSSKKKIHKVLELLPLIMLGMGANQSTELTIIKKTPYVVPKDVFSLMGIKGKYAIDLYKIMLGVWGGTSSYDPKIKSNKKHGGGDGSIQSIVNGELQGRIPIQQTSLTNVRLIDLMKRFSNDLINETYACFRLDEKTKLILPKLIIRQKPFNTEHGIKEKPEDPYKKIEGTKFLSLPRWKISADLIYSINLSRNDSLRVNFVHIIGTTGTNLDDSLIATQNASGATIKFDEIDISRSGLRPVTRVSNFDWPESDDKEKNKDRVGYAPHWADLMFDWMNNGHLRINGTIQCVGIEDDICIGDNLELRDTVYQIESITHAGFISSDGKKSFRTNLTVTHGTDKRSSAAGPVYPEMDYTDTLLYRQHDYKEGYDILPGFSDTQDILGRDSGEETKETRNGSYTPYKLRKKSDNDGKN